MSSDWQRLSPRMLLVHPVHEVIRQLPLLLSSVVLGSATGNPAWLLFGLVMVVGLGLARWFTTSYRIDAGEVALRTGVLQRNALSLPRNRIRSVQTDARLLHRLLGLTVLKISTGQEARGDQAFELDAVEAAQVPALRAELLTNMAGPVEPHPAEPVEVLARWQPSWLRYSPLSWSGLAMLAAGWAVLAQTGFGAALGRSGVARSGVAAAERFGVLAGIAGTVTLIVLASVVLAVGRSLLTFGNLVLTRTGANLHLTHGLSRVRERTYDLSRLRGATLREPLLVRALGGARLDAIMTGVGGAGESSLLLPPCPAGTAGGVLADLVGDVDVVAGSLDGHGPAAARRRWTRALAGPALLGIALAVGASTVGLAWWVWVLWALVVLACVPLAADRVRSLGHRVTNGWLITRQGSAERRRDCVETVGIIGWTVRQTYFQRRAGVATLVAATAAGTKRYEVLDVPAELAWSVAAASSPWVAGSVWAHT